MTSTNKNSSTEHALRQRAEEVAREYADSATKNSANLSPQAMLKVIHELRVHQIELEMQNDELRRTQDVLDTAQARYFDFYDLAPVSYVTVGEHGLILHANLTAATLLGVARSQLTSKPFSRFIAREDQDSFYLLRKQLLERGKPQSREFRMVRNDGSSFFVRMDAIAARDDDGAPVLRLVLIDISASKEATALRHILDLEILNSIHAEIVVLDQHGVIRLMNDPWQRFALDNCATPGAAALQTGIGADYLAACQTHCNNPSDVTNTAHEGIRAVLTGALPSFTLEYTCHSPDHQLWFSMRALPLSKNPKDGITITHTDITAHRRAEEELRIAAVAFDGQEAIVVMNTRRQILRVNQAFTDITGYSQQELMGKTIDILYSKRHPAAFYEAIWRETNCEGRERGGRWVQHKNGDNLFAYGTTTAVKASQGQTTHYVITFSDQTEPHQQEQQRVLHENAHREALVREVHHRIKNNLQGIGGLLQQFASQKPEIAEQMQLVAGHLKGISVIHGLQGRHHKSMVRLCELTSEIAQATSVLWQTAISVHIPANWIFRVVAEKEAVSMALVLNELLVNAVKHGGKAQGHVSVTLQQGQGIEGVELSILNAGYLRNNKDRPTEHHHGLQLIESLRPRAGLQVTLTQRGNQVQTLLHITAPVLTLDTEK